MWELTVTVSRADVKYYKGPKFDDLRLVHEDYKELGALVSRINELLTDDLKAEYRIRELL